MLKKFTKLPLAAMFLLLGPLSSLNLKDTKFNFNMIVR